MAIIQGTGNADILIDTGSGDNISALGGDDLIYITGGMTDLVDAGSGFDTIFVDWRSFSGYVTNSASEVYDNTLANSSGGATVLFSAVEQAVIYTGSGNDNFNTGSVRAFVYLGAGADSVTAGADADYLDGGLGADTLSGGAGADRYIVDDCSDVIVEGANGGYDIVYSRSSYSLAPGVHVEVLGTINETETTTLDLAGNELNNLIIGNAGNNGLFGLAGPDYLMGLAGNDILDGGAGVDFHVGGAGNDIYFVDSTTDVVSESPGEGFDALYAGASYVLGTGVEVELFATTNEQATTPFVLTGNELNNTIFGNAGDNGLLGLAGPDYLMGLAGNDLLDGGTGSDFHVGGAGDDIYFVDDSLDVIVETADQGHDFVYARVSFELAAGVSVELLGTANEQASDAITLTGNELNNTIIANNGNNNLSGRAGPDYLMGLAGNDKLHGGAGSDFLVGGAGADSFLFNDGDSLPGSADTILGFESGTDIIDLGAVDADSGTIGNQDFKYTSNTAFTGSAGELIFISGVLYGDTDGDKDSDFQLNLPGVATLTQADLQLLGAGEGAWDY